MKTLENNLIHEMEIGIAKILLSSANINPMIIREDENISEEVLTKYLERLERREGDEQ